MLIFIFLYSEKERIRMEEIKRIIEKGKNNYVLTLIKLSSILRKQTNKN